MNYQEIIDLMCRKVCIYHKHLTEKQLDEIPLRLMFAMCHPDDREEIDRYLKQLK
jgi:hypothetical protein